MTRLRTKIVIVAVALLAFGPLALFAYLGHFSRMAKDDYAYLGKPLESGAWEAMLFWRENWNGDYTNFLLYGLLAPFGERLPAIFPSIIIVVGLAGYTAFNSKMLSFLGVKRHRRLFASALASLTLVACIGGSYSLLTVYWFAASVEYVLPVVILVICLVIGAKTVEWASAPRRLSVAAIVFLLLGFLNAGFSEMFLVFQALTLALLALYTIAIAEKPERRSALILILAALLGTALGAGAQATAAGVAYRLSLTELWTDPIEPVRELPILIVRTLETLPAYLTHPFAFSGFKMLAAAGLAVTLALSQPARPDSEQMWKPATPWPLLIGLIIQLGFLPVLWSHSSDLQQVLGRFSYSYTPVLILNLGLIIAFSAMIMRPNRCRRYLNSTRGSLLYHSAALFIIGTSFALPDVREVVARAGSYFNLTSYLLAGIYVWQLAFFFVGPVDRQAKRVGLLSLAPAGITVVSLAVMIAVVSWVQGTIYNYTLSLVVYPFALTGLLWGASVGMLIRRQIPLAQGLALWYRALILLSLLAAIVYGWNLVSAQTQKIDELAESARIWDETHQEILELLDEDKSAVHSREFLFRDFHINRHNPLEYSPRKLHWHEKLFYGLEYEPSFG